MTNTDVAVIALLVMLAAVLAAIVWRKDVKAAFNLLGLGSFSLEATEPKRKTTRRPRSTRDRRIY